MAGHLDARSTCSAAPTRHADRVTWLSCPHCHARNSDPGGPVAAYACGICGHTPMVRMEPDKTGRAIAGAVVGGALGGAFLGPIGVPTGAAIGAFMGAKAGA